MPKFILNVSENWYRRYLVEAPTKEEAISTYKAWCFGGDSDKLYELTPPEYLDDGPEDSWFVEEDDGAIH